MLIEIPPKYAISDVLRVLKSESSACIRSKFKFIDDIYKETGIWGTGYFVSTVGLNEQQIRKYIERQNILDKPIDITNEFS
jgi:putative transposase